MRRSKRRRPEMEEKLDKVERQVREARGRLRWQVRQALIPLDIQEKKGISKLQGQVLIITYDDNLQERIRGVLESDNYRCDVAEGSSRAVGMLRLQKYELIIVDYTRYRRSNIFSYVRRYQPGTRLISIVPNQDRANQMMQLGSYSYLVGRNFDTEQLRTCLVSSLRMGHRVCSLQAQGERCNKSCVNSYQTEDDIMDFDDVSEDYLSDYNPNSQYDPN